VSGCNVQQGRGGAQEENGGMHRCGSRR
jgi:hypothetical protein